VWCERTGDELVDNGSLSDGAADGHQFEVGWVHADEMVRVEIAQLVEADTTGHGGNVVDVRFGNHGGHGCVDVARLKLEPAVRIPQCSKVMSRHRLHLL
jgi:hypothetical protein